MDFPKFRLLEFEHSTGTQRAAMAQDLDLICQDTGFLLLEDHDVAEHTIAAQWEVVTAHFCPSPAKNKKS